MGSIPKASCCCLRDICKAHLFLFVCVNKIQPLVICYGIMASNVHNLVGPQVNFTIFVLD
jgi:hypothetical protein